MRKLVLVALATQLAVLAACGGGGVGPTPPTPPVQVIATPGPPNVEPIVIDAGPAAVTGRIANIAYVTVRICRPGTTQCQDIDHIQVDSGSSGLRLVASAVTVQLDGLNQSPGGLPIAECAQFADGSAWGPLAVADVVLPTSGKTLSGIAVQVIGSTLYPDNTAPASCPTPLEDTVDLFGANGILGVGPFIQDCGPACADGTNLQAGRYYTCPTPATCTEAAIATVQQVSNPVAFFASDNNGVIVELPAVASPGATTLSGSLVFGIGTQSNNALGSATTLLASTDFAYISANYKGTVYANAAIDSGSSANFFTDSSLPGCTVNTGLYCPNPTVNLSAVLTGEGGTMATAEFSVADVDSVLANNATITAVPNVGGSLPAQNSDPNAITFDLGMPFFFGRNVFTGIEGQAVGTDTGPLYAY